MSFLNLPTTPSDHKRSSVHSTDRSNNEANDMLTIAVEKGLSVLGESVAQVILHNLEKKYSLKKQDILKNPDRFVEALQAMFGSGATTIEKLVIQYTCTTVGLNPDTLEEHTLRYCVQQVKKTLRIKKKRRN